MQNPLEVLNMGFGENSSAYVKQPPCSYMFPKALMHACVKHQSQKTMGNAHLNRICYRGFAGQLISKVASSVKNLKIVSPHFHNLVICPRFQVSVCLFEACKLDIKMARVIHKEPVVTGVWVPSLGS